jgi:hypothetical protein
MFSPGCFQLYKMQTCRYWLYAAIKLNCLLVTNDEMRDHIFELLGSSFFPKWKQRHRVSSADIVLFLCAWFYKESPALEA